MVVLKADRGLLSIFVGIPFYLYVLVTLVQGYEPVQLPAHPRLMEGLFSGTHQGYVIPGSQLSVYSKFLPESGTVTFIMDVPYKQNQKADEFYYDVQSYFAPLLLDHKPAREIAMVFCANKEIAGKRLAETGYEWSRHFGNGKGMAQKIK